MTIHPEEARTQILRARQASPECRTITACAVVWSTETCGWPATEPVKRRGSGTPHTTFQLQEAAAVHNLGELGRVLVGAWRPRVFRPRCLQTAV